MLGQDQVAVLYHADFKGPAECPQHTPHVSFSAPETPQHPLTRLDGKCTQRLGAPFPAPTESVLRSMWEFTEPHPWVKLSRTSERAGP